MGRLVFLYIVLGLAAIITIALAARIRLNIAYKSGEDAELRVILRYLFIFRQLAPEPKKVRLRDYTFKTHGAKKRKRKLKTSQINLYLARKAQKIRSASSAKWRTL